MVYDNNESRQKLECGCHKSYISILRTRMITIDQCETGSTMTPPGMPRHNWWHAPLLRMTTIVFIGYLELRKLVRNATHTCDIPQVGIAKHRIKNKLLELDETRHRNDVPQTGGRVTDAP